MFIKKLNCSLKPIRSFALSESQIQNNDFFFFFLLLTIDFLKMLINLAFIIPTLTLFHLLIQYGKNVLLKDFVLVGTSLIIEIDDDLSR